MTVELIVYKTFSILSVCGIYGTLNVFRKVIWSSTLALIWKVLKPLIVFQVVNQPDLASIIKPERPEAFVIVNVQSFIHSQYYLYSKCLYIAKLW